ncbi:hypothetical protein CC658_17860 [Salmonella enterica subsp. enterica serovar Koketime]|nr:hypothetical protein [Salmonella enterica subsp. enterica serovar Koketime]EAM8932314.1 hypothetical protein [Salmonella enterica]EBX3141557.1 hypothetical protein [Salmonella enterica subsp. enterica serovar Ealing]EBR9058409.1 hypothetical protein [Salmonella enterica subsp. enterica serovar Koketime]EBV0085887.1 hypothetical protein [Salmonella enterica subsp. enterica serovar Koketime]
MPDGATFILSTARRRRPGKAQPPSCIKRYNYQHIGDENVDSVRVTGLSHRVPDGYPAATS